MTEKIRKLHSGSLAVIGLVLIALIAVFLYSFRLDTTLYDGTHFAMMLVGGVLFLLLGFWYGNFSMKHLSTTKSLMVLLIGLLMLGVLESFFRDVRMPLIHENEHNLLPPAWPAFFPGFVLEFLTATFPLIMLGWAASIGLHWGHISKESNKEHGQMVIGISKRDFLMLLICLIWGLISSLLLHSQNYSGGTMGINFYAVASVVMFVLLGVMFFYFFQQRPVVDRLKMGLIMSLLISFIYCLFQVSYWFNVFTQFQFTLTYALEFFVLVVVLVVAGWLIAYSMNGIHRWVEDRR